MSAFTLVKFAELPSTNDYAVDNLNQLNNGTIICADKQTNGHGRFNRKWQSDNNGNLYFSIVLKPDDKCRSVLANITQYMAVIICETFAEYGVHSNIKWPNDVLVDGKKISGILAKTVFDNDVLEGCVLGVGINLNMSAEELSDINQPATSLNILIGKTIDKENFLEQLVAKFFAGFNDFLRQGFLYIKDRYNRHFVLVNKVVNISNLGHTYTGIVQQINDDGSILLNENGNLIKILSGDIEC